MKVLKWLFLGFLAAAVLLVAGIYIHNKALGPAGWAQADTEKKLRALMKDPESMRITSVFVIEKQTESDTTEIYVCGVVDARNSFGGYSGGSRFASKSLSIKSLNVFDSGDVHIEDEEQRRTAAGVGLLSSFQQVIWNKWCVDSTHPRITSADG